MNKLKSWINISITVTVVAGFFAVNEVVARVSLTESTFRPSGTSTGISVPADFCGKRQRFKKIKIPCFARICSKWMLSFRDF